MKLNVMKGRNLSLAVYACLLLPALSYSQIRIHNPSDPYNPLFALSIPDSLSKQEAESMKYQMLSYSDNDVPKLLSIDYNLNSSNKTWNQTYYTSAERLIYLMILKDKASLYDKRSLGEIYYTIHYVILDAMSSIHDTIDVNDVYLSMRYLKQSANLGYANAYRKLADILYHGHYYYIVDNNKYVRIKCEPNEDKALDYLRKASLTNEEQYQKFVKRLKQSDNQKRTYPESTPEYTMPQDIF